MFSQLLVCDEIKLLEGQYELGKVVNEVTIPTLPYVYRLPVFIKLIDIDTHSVDINVSVYDSHNELLTHTPTIVYYIKNRIDGVSGLEINLAVTVVISSEGIFVLKLFVDNNECYNYPIRIIKATQPNKKELPV